MAQTSFSTNDAQTKKVYDENLYRDSRVESYWEKFRGKTQDSLVQVKTDLTKEKGDTIKFNMRRRLRGAGVRNTILKGNEEALEFADDSVSINYDRHAVSDDGSLSRQRVVFDIDDESESALKVWGSEHMDDMCFDAAFDASNTTHILYRNSSAAFKLTGTAGTASGAMHATGSLLTPQFITQIKSWAKSGGDRLIIPIRPIMFKGKKYYVLLAHDDLICELKLNTELRDMWKNAVERGYDNPLFSDAELMVDGVLIHSHESCPTATAGGVYYGQAIFMGAQALLWAEGGRRGSRPEIIKETDDYQDINQYAWGVMAGVKKPKFDVDGTDANYGSVMVYASATQVATTALV
jgi:N4-gp56 family major capsid protein